MRHRRTPSVATPAEGRDGIAGRRIPARPDAGPPRQGVPALHLDRSVERPVVRELVQRAMTQAVEASVTSTSRRLGALPAVGPVVPASPFDPLLATLRESLAGYVRRRRGEGAPVERVLPEVKALVHEAEFAEAWPDELGLLMAQVVRWTIEAYYDGPTRLPDVASGG